MLKKKVVSKKYKTDMNKVREDFNKSSGGGGAKKMWLKIDKAPGNSKVQVNIRVLPPWGKDAEGHFYHLEAQHFGFTIAGRSRAITCLESVGKGDCPVCKFRSKLVNDGGKKAKKIADRIRPSWRYFMNVYDRADKTIKMWGTSKKIIQDIMDANDDIGDITDPDNGHDIIITRRGSGFTDTRYTCRVRPNASPVKFKQSDLYKLHKDVNEILTEDQILALLKDNYFEEMQEYGMMGGKKKVKLEVVKTKKSKAVDEDEEDTDDDEEEDEEDTDDDDTEDEDTDEDGDEEEDSDDEEEDEEDDDEDEE